MCNISEIFPISRVWRFSANIFLDFRFMSFEYQQKLCNFLLFRQEVYRLMDLNGGKNAAAAWILISFPRPHQATFQSCFDLISRFWFFSFCFSNRAITSAIYMPKVIKFNILMSLLACAFERWAIASTRRNQFPSRGLSHSFLSNFTRDLWALLKLQFKLHLTPVNQSVVRLNGARVTMICYSAEAAVCDGCGGGRTIR